MAITLQTLLNLKGDFVASLGKNKDAAIAAFALMGGASGKFNKQFQDGFEHVTQLASSGFGVLTGHYSQLENVLGALPGPIGVVGGAIGGFLGQAMEDTAQYADTVDKLGGKIGESVEWTSSFIEAADDYRVSQEAVNTSLSTFSRNLGNATDAEGLALTGGKGVAAVLKEIGINAYDANGKTRSLSDLLPEIADRFQAIGPGAQATALATQLFGKAGADLLPILFGGGAQLKEFQQSAINTGLALTNEGVQGFKNAAAAADELNDRLEAEKRKLSQEVIPIWLEFVKNINYGIDFMNREAEQGKGFFQVLADSATYGFTRVDNSLQGMAGASAETGAVIDAAADQISGSYDQTTQSINGATQANLSFAQSYVGLTGIISTNEAVQMGLNQARSFQQQQVVSIIGALNEENAVMNQAQMASASVALATGQMAYATFEAQQASLALMAAYQAGTLTMDQAVAAMSGVANGTLSTSQAFQIASSSGGVFKDQMNAVEVAASGSRPKLDDMTGSIGAFSDRADGTWSRSRRLVGGLDDTKDAADDVTKSFKGTNQALQNVPNSKTVTVTARTSGIEELRNMAMAMNSIYSKFVTADVGVSGTYQLQNLLDKLNELRRASALISVYTTVNYVPQGGYGLSASKGDTINNNSLALNTPITLGSTRGAAREIERRLQRAQRQAKLRAAMGG